MEKTSIVANLVGFGWLNLYWLLYGLTNVACAYYTYQDAIKRKTRALHINHYWWAVFALFGGIWTVFVYWLMEYSALRPNSRDAPEND